MKKVVIKRHDHYGKVGEIVHADKGNYAWETRYIVKTYDGYTLFLNVTELVRVGDWK